MQKLDAIGYRWLAALSTFDFDLQYRRGLNHRDADGLSRRPQGSPQSDDEYDSTLHDISRLASRVRPTVARSDTVHITCAAMNAILSSHKATEGRPHSFEGTTSYIEMLTTDSRAIPDEFISPVLQSGQVSLPTITKSEWRAFQNLDPDIAYIKKCMASNHHPVKREYRQLSREAKVYVRNIDKLAVINGVLYRIVNDEKGLEWQQLVLPLSHRERAMAGLHDEVGHLGTQNTLRIARQRFFWPLMASDIEAKCKSCERCIRRKAIP